MKFLITCRNRDNSSSLLRPVSIQQIVRLVYWRLSSDRQHSLQPFLLTCSRPISSHKQKQRSRFHAAEMKRWLCTLLRNVGTHLPHYIHKIVRLVLHAHRRESLRSDIRSSWVSNLDTFTFSFMKAAPTAQLVLFPRRVWQRLEMHTTNS
jgi:hypothetical protein